MDFTLTDEQRMVRDTARALFDAECPIDLVRTAWEQPQRGVALAERHLADWTELGAADVVDVAIFAEEHGRAAAPGPFFASLLAAQLAGACGRAIAASASVAVSAADGLWHPNDERVKHFVPNADDVAELWIVGGSDAAPRLAVAPRAAVETVEVDQLDRLRRLYRVDTRGVAPGEPIDPGGWRHAVERVLVTCAAELVGVGRHLLDGAIEYARGRVQFGRPIGSFQGLQWMLVDAALELERASASVAYAAMCVDAGDADRHRAVHAAKAEAGLAARRCARTALQVHGGIGFTWEHGLHYWLRRALAGDAFAGPSAHHHDRLAELILD